MTRKGEAGSALVLVLLAAALLAVLGAALAAVTDVESVVAAHYQRTTATMYAADAAIECAAGELASVPDWSGVLQGQTPSRFAEGSHTPTLPSGRTVSLDARTAALNTGPSGGPDGQTWILYSWGAAADMLGGAAGETRAYVAVWVADDPADADGDPRVDQNGRLMLHAEAYDAGDARSTIDVELARAAPVPAGGLLAPRLMSWRQIE